MATTDTDAPRPAPSSGAEESRPWMRGVYMIIFLVLFAVAETVLTLVALLQFGWLIVYRQPQEALTRFGAALGRWLDEVARYQSARSEIRPFPWSDWPKGE